ncbi:lambda family phage tail tape measure protein [Paraburkholderia sp. GAS199]
MYSNDVKIKVSADSSGFTAAIDRANQRISAYAASTGRAKEVLENFQSALDESGAATAKQVQQIAAAVVQMDRMASTAGKTQAQLASMKAEGLGITSAMQGYVNQIEAATAHTHGLGLETTAARRELMVLAHEASQGNWKRFGGSLMVLGEQMDATRLIMNPFTLGLVAVGGAAAVMYKQIDEANARVAEFHEAMDTTSGYAGQTRESIQGLAETLSSRFGISVGAATDDLNKLVASGRVSADVFLQVATVASAMAKTTGEAFDKVLEGILKQQENVKKAADEYQAAHHTMTDADMALIESLEKTGQKHQAFTVLIQRELDDIVMSTKTHTSAMASYWDGVTAAEQRYARALSGNSTDLDKLNDLKAKQAAQQSGKTANYDYTDYGPLIAAQQKIVDATNADQAAADRNNKTKVLLAESQAEVAKQFERTLNPQQKLTEALKRDNEIIDNRIKLMREAGTYTTAAQAQLEAQRKQMVAFDTEHITPAKKQHSNAGAFAGQIAETTRANAALVELERQKEKNLRAQYEVGVVDAETYYRQLTTLQENALDSEIANAQKRVDLAKAKPQSAAYQEALRELQKLNIHRTNLEQGLNNTLEQMQKQRTTDIQRYAQQGAEALRQQTAAYTVEDATRYATPQQRSDYDAQYQLAQQFAQKMQVLYSQYALDPASDKKAWQEKQQAAYAAYAEQQQALTDHLATEQSIRESYSAQMHGAISALGGDAMTNAQLVATSFSTAWQDSANALEQFVTTGKGSFSQFTASILADMAKIALRQAEMQIFQSISSSWTGFSTGGSVGHYATGGSISGPGSGTSDSIPAMLSNGEFVVNASAANQHRSLLESINSGQVAHFASGGAVGDSVATGNDSGGSGSGDLHFHLDGSARGGGLSAQDAKELLPVFQAIVDKRMDQKMRGQGAYAYQIKNGFI